MVITITNARWWSYGPEDDSKGNTYSKGSKYSKDDGIEVIGCGQLVPAGETAEKACKKAKPRR